MSVLALIQELPSSVSSVLLVGHNPTFEDLALSLVGTGPPDALDNLDRKYPTGALAILDFMVDDWRQVAGASGYLREFVRPRELPSS
jgi:phosphohistidine phosphatase